MTIHSSNDVYAALRKIFVLPEQVVSLTLKLAVNEIAEVECTFHPALEVDVTTLDSRAMSFQVDRGGKPVTKRFELVEIKST